MRKADAMKSFRQLPEGGQQLLKMATQIINAMVRKDIPIEEAEAAMIEVLSEMKEDIRKGHYRWVMLQLKTIFAQELGSGAKN